MAALLIFSVVTIIIGFILIKKRKMLLGVSLIYFFVGFIGVIITTVGLFDDDSYIPVFIGMILLIGSMLVSVIAIVKRDSVEQNKKSETLSRLAKRIGFSDFRCTIGSIDSPFCIDTVHGLFAGECVVDTVEKIVVATLSHILTCSLDEEYRTVNNAKSRTIVGGLLAGTVGAIAGASSAKEHQEFAGYVLTIVTDLSNFGTVQYHGISRDYGLQIVQYLKP